ncbi:MAG TPA: hypothetical protein VK142_09805, partial [Bacillota bacterium]|nr:hypothetical protein [Bacillota bacterium]
PLWDWQSRICLDIIHPYAIGDEFSYTDCKQLLNRNMGRASYYPLMKMEIDPIQEYLDFLVKEGTIRQISDLRYKKVKHISFYSTLDRSMEGDRLLMDALR